MIITQRANNIKRCFNKAALTYDLHCHLQCSIGEQLIARLKRYKPRAQTIIDLGCGTGLITEQLINQYNDYRQFYALDISDQFLQQARARLAQYYDIVIQEGNFDVFAVPEPGFDLMFSNMALQWSHNLAITLANLYNHLLPAGVIAFTLPLAGTFCELTENCTLPFYRFEQIEQLLARSNFTILHASSTSEVQQFASKLSALKSIKLTGATYYGLSKYTPTIFAELLKARNLPDSGFCLTYKLGIFIAIKN